jgi:hypothetical protein
MRCFHGIRFFIGIELVQYFLPGKTAETVEYFPVKKGLMFSLGSGLQTLSPWLRPWRDKEAMYFVNVILLE